MRVPFDASTFPGLQAAFREDIVARLTFARAVPSSTTNLPAHLQPLAGLCEVWRTACRYQIARGPVPIGSTFVGGDFADLGDVPWPVGSAGPLSPILQIGLGDARKIGLDDQINVFFDAADPTAAHPLPSLLPTFIQQQVAGRSSPFHVIACRPGRRVAASVANTDATPLALIDEVSVFPDIIGLQSAHDSLEQDLPIDVTRFWNVQVARNADYRSIQQDIAKYFPTTCDVAGDVILGGFSSLHVRGSEPFKRLATFSTSSFAWSRNLVDEWQRAALEVSFAGSSSIRAWLHGAS